MKIRCDILLSSFALLGLLSAEAVAQTTEAQYTAVNGRLACTNDSNAMKANRGESIGGLDVWRGCVNCVTHALFVTHPKVVGELTEDGSKPATPPGDPAFTLRHLLTEMGGWRGPGAVVHDVFNSMLTKQEINGFGVEPRRDIASLVINPWMDKLNVATLDELAAKLNDKEEQNAAWDAAPFKLIAIGYRPDLVRGAFDEGRISSGGEGRFVFQVLSADNAYLPFTLIFEYSLPAANTDELVQWARDYNELTKLDIEDPAGSGKFSKELAKLTRKFTDRNVAAAVPNNVTLGQLRTNELVRVAPMFAWELREFRISHKGALEPAAVQLNPDLKYNGAEKALLLEYLADTSEFKDKFPGTTIPWSYKGTPFLAGSSITPAEFVAPGDQTGRKVDTWLAGEPGVDEDTRHVFASSTCNGCHGGDAIRKPTNSAVENNILVPNGHFRTGFTHIDARGRRAGHFSGIQRADTMMSEFLCSADLPERVRAMLAFLQPPKAVAAALFEGATGIQAATSDARQRRLLTGGVEVIRRNFNRVH